MTSNLKIHTPMKGVPQKKMSSSPKVPVSKRNIIATPAQLPRRKV